MNERVERALALERSDEADSRPHSIHRTGRNGRGRAW